MSLSKSNLTHPWCNDCIRQKIRACCLKCRCFYTVYQTCCNKRLLYIFQRVILNMPGLSPNQVTLSEVLEVRGGPLEEDELWALLYECCDSVKDYFLRGMYIHLIVNRRVLRIPKTSKNCKGKEENVLDLEWLPCLVYDDYYYSFFSLSLFGGRVYSSANFNKSLGGSLDLSLQTKCFNDDL